jgi:hypothetical protein
LIVKKWVVVLSFLEAGLDRYGAIFVIDRERECKSTVKFDEPLIHEGVGDENKNAFRPATELETVKDQAGLDRFSESHFVGEEDTGGITIRHFFGDVKLVGDERDAPADKSPNVTGSGFVLIPNH